MNAMHLGYSAKDKVPEDYLPKKAFLLNKLNQKKKSDAYRY